MEREIEDVKNKPRKYPCQDCKERHAGCHADCEAYLEARKQNQAANAEERKDIEKQLDFVRYKIESRERAKRQAGKTKKY